MGIFLWAMYTCSYRGIYLYEVWHASHATNPKTGYPKREARKPGTETFIATNTAAICNAGLFLNLSGLNNLVKPGSVLLQS